MKQIYITFHGIDHLKIGMNILESKNNICSMFKVIVI